MQDRSEYWQACAADGEIPLQALAIIDGTEYSASSAPVIKRGLFPDAPSIGNCTAASLTISILSDDDISKSAETVINARYAGDETSEWVQMGVFYVSKRSKDYASGLLTLTCYDAMLKANQSYFDDDENPTGVWPQAMSDTLDVIAEWMGVEIDERTVINTGDAYMVPCPTGMTILQVLGEIAAAHGGNFIITPQGKLRLVPLTSADAAEDGVDVPAILGALTKAEAVTISGIALTDSDGNSYTSGDNTGYVLSVDSLPCASQELCDTLYEQLGGLVYQPYTMTNAIYDPAAELGDRITYTDQLNSILCYEELTLNISYRMNASAESVGELEDEYPYQSSTSKLEKAITQVSASIETTATSVASSIVERSVESILATVSETYATLKDYEEMASVLDGVAILVEAYYAISESADEYPDLNATDGLSALAGYARAGVAYTDDSGWVPEMPEYEDGDYVWLSYLITYADGTQEWTAPALIVDGSVSSSIITLQETAASIQILTDTILQSITATNGTWYTGDYAIAVTSTGTPDEAGVDASLYKDAYYLDQTTGYVYLSDGESWTYAAALESTVSKIQNTIEQSISDSESTILQEISATYATTSYVDEAADDAETAANAYTDGKLAYYSTATEVTNAITQAVGESETSIKSEISTVTTELKQYADEAASSAETSAQEYTDGLLVYYSNTETMNNAITQAVGDMENSITSEISTTYATKVYADDAASDAQSAAEGYTDNALTLYSTTETMTNAITQAITDSKNAIMLEVSTTYATTTYVQDTAESTLEAAESYTEKTVSASLVLEIAEDEDGTKYGRLSANANYIEFNADELAIYTDDFTLENGSAVFSGALEAASGTFAGELVAASGTFTGELQAASGTFNVITGGVLQSDDYVAGESGLYIDITNGIIDCASLTATLSEGLLITVSETYATIEDYEEMASVLDEAAISVVAYYAISGNAEEYPEFDITDGLSALTGYARAGVAYTDDSGWTPDMPSYGDGDYVWLAYLITYANGDMEWTEPALIVDGSLSENIVTLQETTASIRVLTNSILQSVTATNTTWYTGSYTVAVTSIGTPDDAGVDASMYNGLYYLDQQTGYVYLSDGTSWTYTDALKTTAETIEALISTSISDSETVITSAITKSYEDYVADALGKYSTTETIENYITQTVGDSENSIKQYVSETYATAGDVQSAVSASLVLEILTDEDGTKYGGLSANANYIEFNADELAIYTDDFTLENGSAVFSGSLEAASGTFTGELVAATGTFGGKLQAASGTFSGDLQAAGGTFSGDLRAASGTFDVITGGILQSENYVAGKSGMLIDITDGTITSTYFAIDSEGANFSGELAVTSGIIGGWTIGKSALYGGTDSLTSTDAGAYIGKDGIRYVVANDYNELYLTISESKMTVLDNTRYASGNLGDFIYESYIAADGIAVGANSDGSDFDYAIGGIYMGVGGTANTPIFIVYGQDAESVFEVAPYKYVSATRALSGYVNTTLATTINNSLTVNGDVTVTGTLTLDGDISGVDIPTIQTGTSSSVTVSAGDSSIVSVSFDEEFSSVPCVVACASGGYPGFAATIYGVTTTGFAAFIYNATSSSRSMAVQWIATA